MNVELHALATKTPRDRRYIQEQSANRPHASIAREIGDDATTVKRCWLYNHHINQKALGHQPPIGAMKEWHRATAPSYSRRNRST